MTILHHHRIRAFWRLTVIAAFGLGGGCTRSNPVFGASGDGTASSADGTAGSADGGPADTGTTAVKPGVDGDGDSGPGVDDGPSMSDLPPSNDDNDNDNDNDGADAMIECPGDIGADCTLLGTRCRVEERCRPVDDDDDGTFDRLACVPDDGDGEVGEACTGDCATDTCGRGAVCPLHGDADTSCRQLCKFDNSLPCDAGSCVELGSTGVGVCRANCDPISQNCPLPQGCYPSVDTMGFSCGDDASMGGSGECRFSNQCEAGSVCILGGDVAGCSGPMCCAPLCDLDLADPCEGPDECLFFGAPRFPDVGVCVAP